jgi:hypothetical protein
LITSRSFQPGAKTTNIFLSAVGSRRIQGTAHMTQSDTKILNFRKINEDRTKTEGGTRHGNCIRSGKTE